ncbi:transposase [Streptococcus suis]|nr:transposase [Streptococcus suis]
MDEFFDWCREQSVLPGSKLGTALEYSLKYETTFRTVLSDGDLVLSNNVAERAMKTLVMGRKNWLFSQSFEGAKSTAIILSLLETAKRHELDTEKYMTYLLDNLPNEETLAKKEVLEAYLPWEKHVNRKRFQSQQDFGAFSIYLIIGRLQSSLGNEAEDRTGVGVHKGKLTTDNFDFRRVSIKIKNSKSKLLMKVL